MLTRLYIKNFALIAESELNLSVGFSVMTGETGAGKSMLTGALSLCLGAKAKPEQIRPGADTSTVEATFEFSESHPAAELLKEYDIELEEGELILRRQLVREGKSKAFANGMRLTQAQLVELGERLVDIHGQNDQQLLLKPARHADLLDRFGGAMELRQKVRETYKNWQQKQQVVDEAHTRLDGREREEELLAAFVEEFEKLAYEASEEKELSEERQRLMGGEQVTQALQEAQNALDAETGALTHLGTAEKAMSDASQKVGGDIAEIAQRLWQVYSETADLSRELNHLSGGFEPDPARLQEVDDRLTALKDCARKHGVDLAELPEKEKEIRDQYEGLSTLSEDISLLEKEAQKARDVFDAACAKLTEKRKDVALDLAKKVETALNDLKMAGTSFKVDFLPLSAAEKNGNGAEKVAFLVATNKGMPLAPLVEAASGGEVSRLMLALKQIFYAQIPSMTLIFDEVDTGIGGAVADAAGAALKGLSAAHQVLSITHQPQVAAKGDAHIKIEKNDDGDKTTTSARLLGENERRDEIARMLSGAEVTEEAKVAAQSLLKGAA